MRTGFFYWETEDYHHDNSYTLNDYLENQIGENVIIIYQDGGYCEVRDEQGEEYSLSASGNGDSYNHRIEIEKL
jgi:hypothetical protein